MSNSESSLSDTSEYISDYSDSMSESVSSNVDTVIYNDSNSDKKKYSRKSVLKKNISNLNTRKSKRLQNLKKNISNLNTRKSKRLQILKKKLSSTEININRVKKDRCKKDSVIPPLKKYKKNQSNIIQISKIKKKHIKYDDMVDSVVTTLISDPLDNLSTKKQKLHDEKWKDGLSDDEIKKLKDEYLSITKEICNEPSIQKILKCNIPFKTKCNLMEKQIIFENTESDTDDHLELKNYINLELTKYKNIDIKFYNKYDTLAKKITTDNNIPLKYQILSSDMEFDNLVYVYNKYLQYTNMNNTPNANRLLNQLNTYIQIPTKCTELLRHVSDSYEKVNAFLYNVKNKLDNEIYGLDDVKEQIIIQLNNTIINPDSNNMNLALIGPQGVGKTALANALAKSINLAFVQINLGGCTDSSFLIGHLYTYEGSCPGIITDSLIKMKSKNGIIFFDEIDKISKTKSGEEISKCLLHIIDNTQNFQFKDNYLGDFSIDLSKIWFVFSLNYENELDKTLKDRLNIINIDGYTKKEKSVIVKNYLLPKYLKKINMKKGDMSFTDDALKYIIDETNKLYDYTTQDKNGLSGVRQLENYVQLILQKLSFVKSVNNFDLFNGSFKLSQKVKLPYIITIKVINELKVFKKVKSYYNGMYV
jgi:ATP-dependent Lon protease